MEGILSAQVVGDPAPNAKYKKNKQAAAVRFYVTHSFIRPLRVSGLSSHQPVSGRSLSSGCGGICDPDSTSRASPDFWCSPSAGGTSCPGGRPPCTPSLENRDGSSSHPLPDPGLFSPLQKTLLYMASCYLVKIVIFSSLRNVNALLDLPHVRQETATRAI